MPRSRAEDEILELVSELVKKWDDEQEGMPDVHGVELVKILMEDRERLRGCSPPAFGAESIVSGPSRPITSSLIPQHPAWVMPIRHHDQRVQCWQRQQVPMPVAVHLGITNWPDRHPLDRAPSNCESRAAVEPFNASALDPSGDGK